MKKLLIQLNIALFLQFLRNLVSVMTLFNGLKHFYLMQAVV